MKVIGKLGAEPFVPFLPLLTREFDVATLIVYVMPVFTSCLRAWITQSVVFTSIDRTMEDDLDARPDLLSDVMISFSSHKVLDLVLICWESLPQWIYIFFMILFIFSSVEYISYTFTHFVFCCYNIFKYDLKQKLTLYFLDSSLHTCS